MTDTRKRPIFVYTMTAGLGDLVILGTVARWIKEALPDGECFFVHRDNPHVPLWRQTGGALQFCNVYSAADMFRFIRQMRQFRREGRVAFGLQMAPGSVQGFLFLLALRKLGALDYLVDFNLVNADIVTPPCGNYILDLHLHQIVDLFKNSINHNFPQRPALPFELPRKKMKPGEKLSIGLHPWSRRGHLQAFVWQEAKWLDLIRCLGRHSDVARLIVFGKDDGFENFKNVIMREAQSSKIHFAVSNSVQELATTIAQLDLLVTVNTGVVHIAYALDIPMVILNGPSLDIWIPKGENIVPVRDSQALFQASDREMADKSFSRVSNIPFDDVMEAVETVILQNMTKKQEVVSV